MTVRYKPLPDDALKICQVVNAPPRLIAHLTLVHDVACKLVTYIQNAFPDIELDKGSVFFGAATHDMGKAVCPEELTGPGKSHEMQGADLMKKLGVSAQRARFAFSHGNWDGNPAIKIEDLLVALADNCWKGKRVSELETKVVDVIARTTGNDHWQVFAVLDDILQKLAADADHRLAWQAQFPAVSEDC